MLTIKEATEEIPVEILMGSQGEVVNGDPTYSVVPASNVNIEQEEVAKSKIDANDLPTSDDKVDDISTSMHLVPNLVHQQHSPGSTSSQSSNGSTFGGGTYTRQTNPRPRSYKPHQPPNTTTGCYMIAPPLPPGAFMPQVVDFNGSSYSYVSDIPTPVAMGGTWMGPGTPFTPAGYPLYEGTVPSIVQGTSNNSLPLSAPPPPSSSDERTVAAARLTPSPNSFSGQSSPQPLFCSNGVNGPQQQQQFVHYQVQQGEVMSFHLTDGQVQVIQGPATVRLVSGNGGVVPPSTTATSATTLGQTGGPLTLSPMGPSPPQIMMDPNVSFQPIMMNHVEPLNTHAQSFIPIPTYGPPSSSAGPLLNGHPPSAAGASQLPPPIFGNLPASTGARNGAPTFISTQYGAPPVPIFVGSTTSPGSPPPSWISQTVGPASYPQTTRSGAPARDAVHGRLIRKSKNRLDGSTAFSTGNKTSDNRKEFNTGVSPHNLMQKCSEGNQLLLSAPENPGQVQDLDSEESGFGHEDEEEETQQQLLVELLSNLRTPRVSEIQARNALLEWGPPVHDIIENPRLAALESVPHDSHFRYEVLLSDKGKDANYRTIFTGDSIDCRLTDLRPSTEYHIRIHAMLEVTTMQSGCLQVIVLKGGVSDTISFTTIASVPSPPSLPKMQSRTKNSINIRWIAPCDNGSHVSQYILEMADCSKCSMDASINYVECYKGRSRSYNVTKLHPSTIYRFRVYAVNECGRSPPSESAAIATQGAPPSAPQPPGLKEATKSSIHLLWSKRVCDEEFILHMDDCISGHGFLPVHHGPESQHISTGLRRNTAYKFRLLSQNDDGKSQWSEEISYWTLPDVPGPPLRPASKGRLHAHSFKVRWDRPNDDGGSKITSFLLEIDGGEGWQTYYQGSECECICENLLPGTQYAVRVACQSLGGVSRFSDTCIISTEPVCPGPCAPPRLHGKPLANYLNLRWGWPDYDGGSHVTEFEVEMEPPEHSHPVRCVYRGRDTDCHVSSLRPGQLYRFKVRAFNRAGAGPWSELLEVISGTAPPDRPKAPRAIPKSPTLVLVSWEVPIMNGAAINEYNLSMAIVPSPRCVSNNASISAFSSSESVAHDSSFDEKPMNSSYSDSDTGSSDFDEYPLSSDEEASRNKVLENRDVVHHHQTDMEPEFISVYRGHELFFEVKGLEPATNYMFNVIAQNSAGSSLPSDITTVSTPASVPSVISGLRLRKCGSNFLSLAWSEPSNNGQIITHYVLDLGLDDIPPCSTSGPETCFLLEGLKPDSTYHVKIKAVNKIGHGTFSSPLLATTRPLPPAPPRCELVYSNHNSLKIKWATGPQMSPNAFVNHYILEMENSRNQFQVIYSGCNVSHKLNKLSENSKYRFRICATNEAGQGPFSQVFEFFTAYINPPPVKVAPRVSAISSDGCLVEWNPIRLNFGSSGSNRGHTDEIKYTVQLTKVREANVCTVYNGGDLSFRLTGLEARSEFSVKVAAVRYPSVDVPAIFGAYSPPVVFSTLSSGGGKLENFGQNSAECSAVESNFLRRYFAFSFLRIFNTRQSNEESDVSTVDDATWSDQRKALLIVVALTIFAIFVAVFVQQLIAWGSFHGS